MLVLKYSLSSEDHFRFNYYRFWQSPAQKKARLKLYLRFIFYTSLVIVFLHLSSNKPFTLQDFGVVVVIISIGCLCLPGVYRYFVRRKVEKLLADEKNASYLALTEHIINEVGIYTKDDYSESKYTWSSFVGIEETEDYYYLFIDTIKAIAIPKRVFASESERKQFESYLSKFLPLKAEFESLKQIHGIR